MSSRRKGLTVSQLIAEGVAHRAVGLGPMESNLGPAAVRLPPGVRRLIHAPRRCERSGGFFMVAVRRSGQSSPPRAGVIDLGR